MIFRSCLILLCLFSFSLTAQQRFSFTIDWNNTIETVKSDNGTYKKVKSFRGAYIDRENGYLPKWSGLYKIQRQGKLLVTLVNADWEELESRNLEQDFSLLTGSPEVRGNLALIKGQPVVDIHMVPMRMQNGRVYILKSGVFEVEVIPQAAKRSGAPSNYANNSVLANGDWYKFRIQEDGVHKITYADLDELGLDPDNINPANLRIYGNGGGMLPEENADVRPDDLLENAIYIEGQSDGSFDPGDYILFNAQSPHRWVYNPNEGRYNHILHVYSDYTYYFITTSLGPGKRVGTQASSGSATIIIQDFEDYAFHEKEENNLIKSGRKFYGDYFNFATTSRSFDFSFPNLIASQPVLVKSSIAGRFTSSSFSVSVRTGGQNLLTHSISSVQSSYTATYANVQTDFGQFTSNSPNITLDYTLQVPSAEAWLDYIEVQVKRQLNYPGSGQLIFRNRNSIGQTANYRISGMNSNLWVWDISDPVNVRRQNGQLGGNTFSFTISANNLREFVTFNPQDNLLSIETVGKIDNQNLHALSNRDMIIVTIPEFYTQAERLASYHRNDRSLLVNTVFVEQIYNEFSSGTPDITAIRDFMKMLYDKAGNDPGKMPQYLLLFGDASYDYKDIIPDNTNFVPTYQSFNSLSPIGSFCSDDYFGFYDDIEGGSITDRNDYLDIAIGRIPCSDNEEAKNSVDKIMHYKSTASLGNWRNNITFVGDDEDNNIHIRDADLLADYIDDNYPVYNLDKIYLDAYQQVSTPGGSRYPEVRNAIKNKVKSGTLIMNYTGHGGVNGWAHERILQLQDISEFDNYDKMPLFITATCEFSKFDDPAVNSAGEQLFFNPNGGAISMVTTTRLVTSYANYQINSAFLEQVFEPYNTRTPTLGETVKLTKNSLVNSGNEVNNRKFVLLGDPAMSLNFPKYNVVTNTVNETDINLNIDTMKALSKITITGEVQDLNGNKMTNFNGIVYPSVFDKPVTFTTLVNDGGSQEKEFEIQKSVIFRGRSTVSQGEFEYAFIVPKDISYNFGPGKLSYYADNGQEDANGYSFDVIVGGTADSAAIDETPPQVEVFMNDENFVFGGVTNESPLLLVNLLDESGINTVSTGIGHDITAILDENTADAIVLNEYYEAELNSYSRGKVSYPMSELEDGRHALSVKAWDVYNNPGEGYTEFVVASSAELALKHVLNYPNPFTTSTNFHFEHNRPGEMLLVVLNIFTVSGKLVKTIRQDILTDGFRVDDIHWDGLDDFGDKIGRGAYVYKLSVRTPDGDSAHKFEKLVILR
ncbi:MAG: type IX secretion system sortase PorU [Chitinophagales bacterium]